MKLRNFAFKNSGLEHGINFATDATGFNIKFKPSVLENCITLVITPIYLYGNAWNVDKGKKKDYILEVDKRDPILYFINKNNTYAHWGSEFIDLFWERHVIRLFCEFRNNDYYFTFRPMAWEGYVDSYTKHRIVNPIKGLQNGKEVTYILKLSEALTEKDFIRKVNQKKEKEKKSQQENNKNPRKAKINRFLKKFGLQLLDK